MWWDHDIQGGARFAAAIDAALKEAEAVVVLWSAASIESAWVQDEAAAGRDSGRLVPVLLDDVRPPLGFRQYQCIDLTGWRGRGRPKQIDDLLAAIAGVGGATAHSTPQPATRSPKRLPSGRLAVAVALGALIVAAIGAGLLWFWPGSAAAAPSVTVVPSNAEAGPQSSALAHSVAVDLGRFQAGPLSGMSIAEAADARTTDYRLELGVTASANARHADLALLDSSKAVLWTATVDSPSGQFVDLRQQASAQAGAILACAARIPGMTPRPTGDVLKLYLTGCARLATNNGDQADGVAISTYRQITQKEPRLAEGWAGLALLECWSYASFPDAEIPAIMRSASDHLERARKLNPNLDLIFAAEAKLTPFTQVRYIANALAIVDRGLKANPDSALLYSQRADFLQHIGRMGEAVESARRAVELDPLSPRASDAYISALAYSGQEEAAKRQLAQAQQVWPGSTVLEQTGYRFNARFGDALAAEKLIKSRGDVFGLSDNAAADAFAKARIAPTRANQDAAIAAYEEGYRRDPTYIFGLVQALGTFGRVDQALALAQSAPPELLTFGSEVIFRPDMRSILKDPRFMGLAARLGFVRVWKQTRVWPDFCSDPELPYDCQKEAAKYPA